MSCKLVLILWSETQQYIYSIQTFIQAASDKTLDHLAKTPDAHHRHHARLKLGYEQSALTESTIPAPVSALS
jgi:hypothetical protein